MNIDIPDWALRTATPEDRALVREARRLGTMRLQWPDLKALRAWAKQQGWPTPWLSFEEAFVTRMLADEESFELALRASGIEIHIPWQDYTITAERVQELDELYRDRSASGRPGQWGLLVAELREIRRAVEAGVLVKIEGGEEMRTWQDFYSWAHGRYHALEDGYDSWIGDDRS
ncbi:MAG TPA: hypothetical protein VF789_22565 [Thermoanaerobaculia bacterium]